MTFDNSIIKELAGNIPKICQKLVKVYKKSDKGKKRKNGQKTCQPVGFHAMDSTIYGLEFLAKLTIKFARPKSKKKSKIFCLHFAKNHNYLIYIEKIIG